MVRWLILYYQKVYSFPFLMGGDIASLTSAHPEVAIVVQALKLDQVLDSESDGVPEHLGQIAESMYVWEGRVADQLGLTVPDVAHIKKKYPNNIKLQA